MQLASPRVHKVIIIIQKGSKPDEVDLERQFATLWVHKVIIIIQKGSKPSVSIWKWKQNSDEVNVATMVKEIFFDLAQNRYLDFRIG